MRFIITFIIILFGLLLQQAAGQDDRFVVDSVRYQQLKSADTAVQRWLDEQMTPGIQTDSTSINISTEVRRIIGDTAYRDSVFHYPYSFVDVGNSLARTNLRLAFWQMINLYPHNQERVLRYIFAYDKLIATDKLFSSAFSTYALLDPRITRVESGKPIIEHPDVTDDIFHTMNEIVEKINQNRSSLHSK